MSCVYRYTISHAPRGPSQLQRYCLPAAPFLICLSRCAFTGWILRQYITWKQQVQHLSLMIMMIFHCVLDTIFFNSLLITSLLKCCFFFCLFMNQYLINVFSQQHLQLSITLFIIVMRVLFIYLFSRCCLQVRLSLIIKTLLIASRGMLNTERCTFPLA